MIRGAHSARPIGLFVADAEPGVIAQVSSWADASEGLLDVHGFTNARELVRRMAYQQPDLLLLDLTMPHFDGLTALRALRAECVPVVLLATDTHEGARLTMQALLDGAGDYLIKRGQGDKTHLAVGRARFLSGVRRLLGTHWAAQVAPCLGETMGRSGRLIADVCPETLVLGGASTTTWVRLSALGERLAVCGEGEPLEGDGLWHGIVLGSPRSVMRVAHGLAGDAQRPAGCVYISVPQPLRFTRGLREALSRRWNRAVLELRDGELPRPGQWRLVPGRALLGPRGAGRGGFRLIPNRLVDVGRTVTRQLTMLGEAAGAGLRILLTERPDGVMLEPLGRLMRAGCAVYLHGQALAGPEPAGPGTWQEGTGSWADAPTLQEAAIRGAP